MREGHSAPERKDYWLAAYSPSARVAILLLSSRLTVLLLTWERRTGRAELAEERFLDGADRSEIRRQATLVALELLRP